MKVSTLHRTEPRPVCDGAVFSYTYRRHPPGTSAYERCISLSWCSTCRDYTGAIVYVPAGRLLDDPLAGLDPDERNRLQVTERRLVEHLDRMIRHGTWTPIAGADRQKHHGTTSGTPAARPIR